MLQDDKNINKAQLIDGIIDGIMIMTQEKQGKNVMTYTKPNNIINFEDLP